MANVNNFVGKMEDKSKLYKCGNSHIGTIRVLTLGSKRVTQRCSPVILKGGHLGAEWVDVKTEPTAPPSGSGKGY
jgi:hypothetical protein